MTQHDGRPVSTPIPWQSALLLVAFIVVSVYVRSQQADVAREGMQALDSARQYFNSHPYLDPGPALALEASAVERARREYEQRRQAQGAVPTPPGVIRREQQELDQQIETTLASVRALPAKSFAFAPGSSPAHTWLAYSLLHLNNVYLIGNGLLLLFFGVYLERSFGRLGYPALLLGLIASGALGWAVVAPPDASHGLVGSTPLLAGLAVVFAARFASRAGEGFYLAGVLFSLLWLALPPWATAKWYFAGLDLVSLHPVPASTAVYGACLGAMVCGGVASAIAWFAGLDGERSASGGSIDPRLRRAQRAREAGRPREALELLSEMLTAEPDHYEAALAAWEVATELGRDAELAPALLRVIRIELRSGRKELALDHWLELARGGIPERVEASLLIHMALLLREHGQKNEAAHALRCALERSDERENHVIAARIARAARGLDPGVSEVAAWRALGSVELSLADRQALENLIGEVLATPAARAASLARVAEPVAQPLPVAEELTERIALEPAAPPRPAAIEFQSNDRALDAVLALPLELKTDGLEIQTSQGHKKLVRYERIEAVAVAAVQGLGAKPVLVVDLVLNWMTPVNETLRVIRLRGDKFDPRRLFANEATAADALRSLIETVIERSNAKPLPDLGSALGQPFAVFEDLAIYQRAVLLAEGPAQSHE
jgi:membrane associated rhomboid family serine protease